MRSPTLDAAAEASAPATEEPVLSVEEPKADAEVDEVVVAAEATPRAPDDIAVDDLAGDAASPVSPSEAEYEAEFDTADESHAVAEVADIVSEAEASVVVTEPEVVEAVEATPAIEEPSVVETPAASLESEEPIPVVEQVEDNEYALADFDAAAEASAPATEEPVLSVEEPKADAEVDEVVVAAEATPRAPDDIAVDDLAGDAASPVSPSEAEYEAEFDTADESHAVAEVADIVSEAEASVVVTEPEVVEAVEATPAIEEPSVVETPAASLESEEPIPVVEQVEDNEYALADFDAAAEASAPATEEPVLSVEEPKADAEVDEVVVAAEATPRAPDDIAVDDLAGDAASPVSPSEAEYEAEFDTADESHAVAEVADIVSEAEASVVVTEPEVVEAVEATPAIEEPSVVETPAASLESEEPIPVVEQVEDNEYALADFDAAAEASAPATEEPVLSVEEPKADAEVDEVVVAAEATPRAPDDIAVDDLAGDAASPVSPSEAEYEAEFDTADESHAVAEVADIVSDAEASVVVTEPEVVEAVEATPAIEEPSVVETPAASLESEEPIPVVEQVEDNEYALADFDAAAEASAPATEEPVLSVEEPKADAEVDEVVVAAEATPRAPDDIAVDDLAGECGESRVAIGSRRTKPSLTRPTSRTLSPRLPTLFRKLKRRLS